MPEPTLQAAALRYAAGDLSSAESEAFEVLLRTDQYARDALAEAVRLSAAALGQTPPEPDRSFRAAIRERLAGYCPAWLRRRAYRGHPVTWTALGAGAVAACTLIGLALAGHGAYEAGPPPIDIAAVVPAPQPRLAPAREIALAPAPREDEVPGDPSAVDSRGRRFGGRDLGTLEHARSRREVARRRTALATEVARAHAYHAGRIIPVSTTADIHTP